MLMIIKCTLIITTTSDIFCNYEHMGDKYNVYALIPIIMTDVFIKFVLMNILKMIKCNIDGYINNSYNNE